VSASAAASRFAPAAAQRQARTARRRGQALPYLLLAPLLVLLAAFTYWPLLYTAYLSVVDVRLSAPDHFVGLANYLGLFRSAAFAAAARNTAVTLVLSLPLNVLLPIPIAVFVWCNGARLATLHRSILFVPTLLSFVVVSIAWIWMLNPVVGMLQSLLRPLGLQMPALLSDAALALPTIIGVAGWKVAGFNALLYLAGLASVPRDLVEAMRIDGAGDWRIARSLLVPLLSPTIYFVALTSLLFAVQQVFTPINIMTDGGPTNATTNLFYLAYQMAFQSFNIGFASATAVLLFAGLGALAALKSRLVGRRVHYQ
jgi:multiple sugar transport system permease protein/sn-glycerol 3-phosphate transport system permease protein